MGVAGLNVNMYEEVEADNGAIGQAVPVVVLMAMVFTRAQCMPQMRTSA